MMQANQVKPTNEKVIWSENKTVQEIQEMTLPDGVKKDSGLLKIS